MGHEIDYALMGKHIRQARERAELTQADLGEKCNLSTSYMGHIERGTRIPSLDTIVIIARILDVSIDSLLLGTSTTISNSLISISAAIDGKNPAKVKTFLTVVEALAEKIDNL